MLLSSMNDVEREPQFLLEIEAKLTVHAFDEASAPKKVEKAFSRGRPLGVDVDAGEGCLDLHGGTVR